MWWKRYEIWPPKECGLENCATTESFFSRTHQTCHLSSCHMEAFVHSRPCHSSTYWWQWVGHGGTENWTEMMWWRCSSSSDGRHILETLDSDQLTILDPDDCISESEEDNVLYSEDDSDSDWRGWHCQNSWDLYQCVKSRPYTVYIYAPYILRKL